MFFVPLLIFIIYKSLPLGALAYLEAVSIQKIQNNYSSWIKHCHTVELIARNLKMPKLCSSYTHNPPADQLQIWSSWFALTWNSSGQSQACRVHASLNNCVLSGRVSKNLHCLYTNICTIPPNFSYSGMHYSISLFDRFRSYWRIHASGMCNSRTKNKSLCI